MKYNRDRARFYHQKTAEPLDVRLFLLKEILKHIDVNDAVEILEIGNFTLDFTHDLYKNFPNAKITSYDSFDEVAAYPELIVYFLEKYKNMDGRVNVVLSKFQESHLLFKEKYDIVVIDIGTSSSNIIEIIKKLPNNKNTFLLLPTGTDKKNKQRNIVLDYLQNNNYNIEILERSWVRLYE